MDKLKEILIEKFSRSNSVFGNGFEFDDHFTLVPIILNRLEDISKLKFFKTKLLTGFNECPITNAVIISSQDFSEVWLWSTSLFIKPRDSRVLSKIPLTCNNVDKDLVNDVTMLFTSLGITISSTQKRFNTRKLYLSSSLSSNSKGKFVTITKDSIKIN